MRQQKRLSVSLLREPERPARSAMDDGGLASLVASVKAVGIIEPLIVKPATNGTYEVIAGHRRLLAARAAELVDVPCVVEPDAAKAEAVKIHENIEREELSPCDEAVYYDELYSANGEDVERVAALVRKPAAYVEDRLLLTRGSEDVFGALNAGEVTLGVARELNRIRRPEDVAYYLQAARRGGCSVRLAREWRGQANARADVIADAAAQAVAASDPAAPAPAVDAGAHLYVHLAKPYEMSAALDERPCLFCESRQPEWKMYRKFVCQPCADQHLVALERRRDG